jgi:hypothetical protein
MYGEENSLECPWGYAEEEQEHLRMCVASSQAMGLGDTQAGGGKMAAPYTDAEWAEIQWGIPADQFAVRAPNPMGVMNVSAGLTPAQKAQPVDYSWLLYGGLALVALMVLGKGRR